MIYTSQQARTAYKKLPSEVQGLITSNETTELIDTTLRELGLTPDQANLADSEIIYSLYCLQSISEAIDNISKISGKRVSDLSNLKNIIEDEILSKYEIDIKDFIEKNKKEFVNQTLKSTPEIPVQQAALAKGVTTETTVPEMAQEIHPKTVSGEVAHDVPHVEQSTSTVPSNLPTGTPPALTPESIAKEMPEQVKLEPKPAVETAPKPEPPPIPKPQYPGGVDPYREPIG
jgi:hypothetical protein